MNFKELTKYNRNKRDVKPWEDNQFAYNCGSFALDVDRWFFPYILLDEDDECENAEDCYDSASRDALMLKYCEEYDREYAMDEITELDATFIEQNCPWVKRVAREDIKDTDDIVAYRIGIIYDEEFRHIDDDDFHFMVRLNGMWFEKRGATNVICRGSKFPDEPWFLNDIEYYDGPIVFFKI